MTTDSTRSPASAVDLVTFGETMALFQPMSDGPLPYAPLLTRSIAGAESNVAIAISRLGLRARWISRLGTDPFGDLIAMMLAGEGVDVGFVARDPDAPTAIFFREIKAFGEPNVYYYRAGSPASRLSPDDVRPEWFAGARLLHVTGITPALGPRTAEAVEAAMKMARSLGLAVSFDPNLRRKLWSEADARRTLLSLVPICDVFLPGVDEAEFLIGPMPLREFGPALLDRGPGIVVLKRGDAGSIGYAPGTCVDAEPFPIPGVVDPIGAGDAFAAGFLSVLLDSPGPVVGEGSRGRELLPAALARANLMGALATQFRGDWEGLPNRSEVEAIETGIRRVSR